MYVLIPNGKRAQLFGEKAQFSGQPPPNDGDLISYSAKLGKARFTPASTLVFRNLTPGRVPFVGSDGALTDDSDMTFATDTLTVTKIAVTGAASVGGGLAVTGTISATGDISVSGAGALAYRLTRGTVTAIWQNGIGQSFFGTTSNHPVEVLSNGATVAAFSATGLVVTGAMTTSDATFIHKTSAALTNGAAAAAGTLLNAPVAGNPTKWIAISDNGTTRYIPCW